jgi:hypothetical protein
MTRSYSELIEIDDFKERYDYLSLNGVVCELTFGHSRYLNQRFYRSAEWKHIRNHIIARDLGCDLGVEGYEIYSPPHIHHMNPMTAKQIAHGDSNILNPEYLITVSHRTHNAIHYGDERQLPKTYTPRLRGDTKLW